MGRLVYPVVFTSVATLFLWVVQVTYASASACRTSGERCAPGIWGFLVLGVPALMIGEGLLCAAAITLAPRTTRVAVGGAAMAAAVAATIVLFSQAPI